MNHIKQLTQVTKEHMQKKIILTQVKILSPHNLYQPAEGAAQGEGSQSWPPHKPAQNPNKPLPNWGKSKRDGY